MQQYPATAAHRPDAPSMAHSLRAVLRFLWVVRRRMWIVVAALIVAGLLGVWAYKTAVPYYQAGGSIMVQQTGLDSSINLRRQDMLVAQTFSDMCISDAVLNGAFQHLEKFPPEVNAGAPSQLRPRMLRGLLTANPRRNSNIVDISCRSRDPRACVSVINAVVRSSMDFMDADRKGVSFDLLSNLDAERRDLEERLFTKERELLEAKRACGDLGVGEDSKAVHPLVLRAMRLNDALLEVQQQRMRLEVALAAVRQTVDRGGDLTQHLKNLEPLLGKDFIERALVLNLGTPEDLAELERQLLDDDARLVELQQRYDVAHPKVAALVEKIRRTRQYLDAIRRQMRDGIRQPALGNRLVGLVQDALANAKHHEQILQTQYGRAEKDAMSLNDRMASVAIAEREVKMLRNLHESLLARIAKVDLNQGQGLMRVTVLSEPLVPRAPAFPNVRRIMLRYLLAGLCLGLMAVYVLDLLDDRFRSPDEIKEQLQLPLLAVVGKLAAAGDAAADGVQVHVSPEAVESEAFRTLRTTLAFSGQPLERLAVTSSEPHDGKTTVLVNLAVAYAQAGKRTLLIDADLRKPRLTGFFALKTAAGLSELLNVRDEAAGRCSQFVQPSGIDGMDILPSGRRPSNPTELLSGARMEELIAWAEARYDQVLIDCPPILSASDAAIIGRGVDGVVLVVNPAKNRRRTVLRAIDSLAGIGVNVVGAVANNPSGKKGDAYYGYGYGYGYGHAYGHQDGREGDDVEEAEDIAFDNETSEPQTGTEATLRVVPRRAA